MLNTVSENCKGFMRREYQGAQEAQRAMHILGFLSERGFENMVRLSMIVNCPINFDGVKNIKLVFGTDIISLKVKSVMRNPDSVVTD